MSLTLLRKALLANASFSALCGVELLFWPAAVGALLGDLPLVALQVLGVGLLLFAAQLVWVATRREVDAVQVRMITWMDWGWVVATPVAMLLLGEYLIVSGYLLLVAIAGVVALCAYFQGMGLRQQLQAS